MSTVHDSPAGGSTSLEPGLVISLGPPTSEPGITLFDAYQRSFGTPMEEGQEHPWVQYEGRVLAVLFAREGERPSPLEEVLSGLRGAPVRIERYERGVGHQRGLWVGNVWIPLHAVRIGGEPLTPWNTAFRELLAAVIGMATRREWIGAVEWSGAE